MSPLTGTVIDLEQVSDAVFSEGAIGKGVAIIPEQGKVVAPLSGSISTLFPTLHAIGIRGDNGIEVLIHLGMDTVNLSGRGFKSFVSQGDYVKQGEQLLEVDLDLLKNEGYETQTPVIITNSGDFGDVSVKKYGEVTYKDELIKVKKG